ncbi:hypothetical protein [Pseudarthrobacter sp. S3]|uniref:hypothetical protein n=1 Tax=unclassified Pseudarthrobacter TaxID=2647000 RepID=UPI003CF65658
MTGPSAEITGIWLHCHEEDTPSSMVFRPRDYPLRPARWRDALELRADGTCIWHGSSPDDRGQSTPGRWEDIGNGQAQITIATAAGGSFPRRIQSWAPDKLMVEKYNDAPAAGN